MTHSFARTTLALALAVAAGAVFAQATPNGYVQTATGTPETNSVRNGAGNLCWRTGYWTPSMATTECDPELVPVTVAAAPPATVAPAPVPAPQAVVPQPKLSTAPVASATISADVLFGFDQATLTAKGKTALDQSVLPLLKKFGKVERVTVTGHADRIGTAEYNLKLSKRRADAVTDYLAGVGVAKGQIVVKAVGETQPLPETAKCTQKSMKELVACLAPNRRVEVEVRGTAK